MGKLVTIGLIGAGVYGLVRILKMKNVSDEIRTQVVNPRIHKVDWGGLTLRADALISNPTKDSLSITKPVVTLTSNGSVLTASTPENKSITIAPLANTKIEAFEIALGWTSLVPMVAGIIGKIPAILESLQGKNKQPLASVLGIPLEMTVSTYAEGIFVKSAPIKLV